MIVGWDLDFFDRNACMQYAYYRHNDFSFQFSLFVIAIIVVSYGIFKIYTSARIKAKDVSLRQLLYDLAKTDRKWTENFMLKMATDKFFIITDAWVRQDIQILRQAAHPKLCMEWEKQIRGMVSRGELNVISELDITSMGIVSVKNYVGDATDEFTVCIDAVAVDQKTVGGIITHENRGAYREFWTFQWSAQGWQPSGVAMSEEWERFIDSSTVDERNSRRKSS